MAQRRRRGPRANIEKPLTTVGGQLVSWALPGGKHDTFEMLSSDDLLTRRGWKTYREMTADDQVKACLWYKKVLLCARPYDIIPASDSASDKEAAEYVQKNLDEMNFGSLMWEALSAFEFGFSAGELMWEIRDDKLRLDDIKFRDPEWMYIFVDKHGDIKHFEQRNPQPLYDESRVGGYTRIPPEKMFHYAYQRQFSNHYGVSDLRAAYRAWWSKKYVTQFWNVFLERFGAPLMMMKYPEGSTQGLKDALQQIMTDLSSKTDILVPEGVVVELIEATRGGNAEFDEALTYYDVRIATATLIPALLGMGVDTKRGSDSQSRLHLRTLMKVIQMIGDELGHEIETKIINPIVNANFNVTDMPRFVFQDYGEFEAFEITDAIKEMFTSGILDLDQEDVNFARSILGLQTRPEDNEDEIRRPDPSMIPAMPGGNDQAGGKGAQPGNDRAKKPVSGRKTDPKTGRQRPSRRKE